MGDEKAQQGSGEVKGSGESSSPNDKIVNFEALGKQLKPVGVYVATEWRERPGSLICLGAFLLCFVAAIGGVKYLGIDVSTDVKFRRVMTIASALFLIGGVIWFLQGKRTTFRLLPLLLGAFGVLASLFLLTVHFLKLSVWGYAFQGSHLDEAVIALVIASLCGFLPAVLSASVLEQRSTEITEQMQTIDKDQKEFLDKLKLNSDLMVKRVNDATRTQLKGFHMVFAQALKMIRSAEKELIYVNFAMNFGAIHLLNDEIKQSYESLHVRNDFPEDIKDFLKKLNAAVLSLPCVKILTVSNDMILSNLLVPLSRKQPYEKLQDEAVMRTHLSAAVTAKGKIVHSLQNPTDDEIKSEPSRFLAEADSLPIQLLITQMRDVDGILRRGCLVFMVGTDMLQSGLASGSEPAFYTEIDDMIEMFENLANGLIAAALRKTIETNQRKADIESEEQRLYAQMAHVLAAKGSTLPKLEFLEGAQQPLLPGN